MPNPYMWLVSKGCLWIWEVSEYTGISLGRLAPWVFGGMIGRWPRKVREDVDAR